MRIKHLTLLLLAEILDGALEMPFCRVSHLKHQLRLECQHWVGNVNSYANFGSIIHKRICRTKRSYLCFLLFNYYALTKRLSLMSIPHIGINMLISSNQSSNTLFVKSLDDCLNLGTAIYKVLLTAGFKGMIVQYLRE